MKLFAVLLLLAVWLPYSSCLFGFIGRQQSVAVKGVLECNGKPAANVKVKLYEKEIFFDRKMDEKRTDSSGSFHLSGSKREITNIDPKVNIYHKCNYAGPCYKKIAITIPDNYITWGDRPRSTFDIGRLNLAGKMKGESIDCIN
ncbi:Transthyretin-like family protein [Ancylostoma ceylanicum]|nr:Transthyretin-like family protein [Ancylostoma ceylanicum]